MRILLVLLALTCISACGFVGFPGVYKINVEQGNIVTEDMADQLKPGMSRRQVRFILGTPLLEDPFSQDQWDYVYVKRNGPDVLYEDRLRVHFDGDSLVKVDGDYAPDWQAPDAADPGVDDEADTDAMTEPAAEQAAAQTQGAS